MSWWCDKCQMLNYGKDKCVGCGYIQEENFKGYTVPSNKGARIKNFKTFEDEKTITLNKNTMFITAVVVIAISVSYLAINKYQENRASEEAFRYISGSSDPDEYKNATLEEKKEMMKNSQMTKDMNIMIKDTEKNIDAIFKQSLGN